jgi:CHAT domain-containing protein
MNSKIVFSKEIVGDSVTNEGYLYAYDLYNLHINASMVVLGSCQTGIGNFKRCDGITSIAHGFSYAGCPSIVYSLWEIDERESSSLMKLFYMQLMTGLPKDEALNNAKRMYLKASDETTANPYYWAGFIFSGDNTAFNFKNKNEYLFYLIPGILLFLIAILYFFLFRRYQSNS